MTEAVSGMTGSLWVCATVGGTYVKLGELSDLRLRIDGKEIDTSNVDDAGWGSSISGARSAEVTATNNLIMTDAGYAILIAAIISTGSTIYAKILQSGTPTATPVGWSMACGVNSGNLTLAGTATQQKADWTIKNRGALAAL
jgi:predicted secreted protein